MKRKSLSAVKTNLNFHLIKLRNSFVKKKYEIFAKNLKSLNLENRKLLVAVSGGADSLSLLFLSKCYSLLENIKLHPVIVDHKLRPESTKEANDLKNALKRKFKINCKILSSKNLIINKNIQSEARDLRYDLILKECLKKNINYILLGHHKDDLLENFFIRLIRGSGLKGLISFNNMMTNFKNIKVIRPLLSFSKKDLLLINKLTYNFFFQDPSNSNDKFLRIKIRNLLDKLSGEGLNYSKFELTLKNLSKSDKVVEHFVNQNIKKNLKYFSKQKKIILSKSFFDNPDEILFRSFNEALRYIGTRKNYSRGKKVTNVIKNLKSTNKIYKSTLSGCIIEKIGDSVIISHEK